MLLLAGCAPVVLNSTAGTYTPAPVEEGGEDPIPAKVKIEPANWKDGAEACLLRDCAGTGPDARRKMETGELERTCLRFDESFRADLEGRRLFASIASATEDSDLLIRPVLERARHHRDLGLRLHTTVELSITVVDSRFPEVTLTWFGASRPAPSLGTSLRDEAPDWSAAFSGAVADALAKLRQNRARIEQLLAYRGWPARYGVSESAMHSPESLPGLTRALDDPDFRVRVMALGAIGGLRQQGRPATAAVLRTCDDVNPTVLNGCIQTLAALETTDPAALDRLAKLAATGPDESTRKLAAAARRRLRAAEGMRSREVEVRDGPVEAARPGAVASESPAEPAWLAALRSVSAPRRMAVLEFGGPLEPDVMRTLSDEVRSAALDALRGSLCAVMTRESMAVVLRDMGIDSCVEGECEVETARNLGADYVISGDITSIDGTLFLTLKLHETARGTLLASKRASGKSALELVELVGATASLLFR